MIIIDNLMEEESKKPFSNFVYLLINLTYLIPGAICALMFYDSCSDTFEFDLPDFLYASNIINNILGAITIIFYLLFFYMGQTFIILLHPIIQIIFFYKNLEKRNVSKISILIIFFSSIIIAFIYF